MGRLRGRSMSVWGGALALAIVVSGCGSTAPSGKKGVSTAGRTIGYSMPDLSEPFWVSMTYGVELEAKKLGVKVILENAGGDTNVNIQIGQLADLQQLHVGAVLVGATDAAAVDSSVNALVGHGIPVIGVSSIPNSTELTALVVTDNTAMGEDEAMCIGSALHGKGQVGAMGGPAGQSWADQRLAGFTTELAKKYPGIQVAAVSRLADSTESGLTAMQDWIQRFPSMAGVYSATDNIGQGAIQALTTVQKVGAVKVATSNLGPGDAVLIKSGGFVCSAAQRVVLQGVDGVKTAVEAMKHEIKGKMHVIATSVTVITKQNIGSVDYSSISAPAGYRP